VLCDEGFCVVLVNFNLVMIMIDLEFVDVIYVEFIIFDVVEVIIVKECLDGELIIV